MIEPKTTDYCARCGCSPQAAEHWVGPDAHDYVAPKIKRGRAAWIGYDLDGTLAVHEEGASIDHVGPPIAAMVARLKQHVAEGYEVRIVTARVCRNQDPEDRQAQFELVEAWCLEHLGFVPEITSEKDFAMVRLYDDRAVGVRRNEGVAETDFQRGLGELVGESGIKAYDRRYGFETDAYADFESEMLHEPGCEDTPIGVYPTLDPDSRFYLSVREARCLAASLLRAADEAEKAGARNT